MLVSVAVSGCRTMAYIASLASVCSQEERELYHSFINRAESGRSERTQRIGDWVVHHQWWFANDVADCDKMILTWVVQNLHL
jgi:hypothetical protein